MRWIIMHLPFTLPKWLLWVHYDVIGQRTWVEWFINLEWIRISFGYKDGKKLDRIYCFGKEIVI